jgi:hypothetical protein
MDTSYTNVLSHIDVRLEIRVACIHHVTLSGTLSEKAMI